MFINYAKIPEFTPTEKSPEHLSMLDVLRGFTKEESEQFLKGLEMVVSELELEIMAAKIYLDEA